MNHTAQKSALTRAVKTGDRVKVFEACRKAVREWNAAGHWPDDWSRWQRALDDVCAPAGITPPRLEDMFPRF